MDPFKEQLLTKLKKVIGHDRWFISGSYAVQEVEYPNDVDVYFLDEDALNIALDSLTNKESNIYKNPFFQFPYYETINSVNVYSIHPKIPVQFVKKYTGSVEDILTDFDLNICKQVIYPDGTYYKHPSAVLPLQVIKPKAETFDRVYKYIERLQKTFNVCDVKQIIDDNIDDSELLEHYYGLDELMCKPKNQWLFNAVMCFGSQEDMDYLRKQAEVHAPELLI